jgi:hypothetical protein
MKSVLLFLVVVLILVIPANAFAAKEVSGELQENSPRSENEFSNEPLTNSEKQILIKRGGFNEVDINRIPPKVLRLFIAENGKKISSGEIQSYKMESETSSNSSENMGTMALTDSDITLFGAAVHMSTNSSTGEKAIYLYGDFGWKKKPLFELVDKMSIGFPVTNTWYLKTSGGLPTGHSSQYCGLNGQLGWVCSSKTQPSNVDIGQGVAAPFDLIGTYSSHKGYISQYVYTTGSGTSNVLFRYGHRTLVGVVAVGVIPAGLAITPSFNTETLDYLITFSW